jgi:hypothetical protein
MDRVKFIPQTFRIFRRSLNRGSFGHREYYLMNKDGFTFIAGRVYDLPLNSEVTLYKHPDREKWTGWAELGFEVPELKFRDAPANIIKEVFKAPAVKANLGAVEMGA